MGAAGDRNEKNNVIHASRKGDAAVGHDGSEPKVAIEEAPGKRNGDRCWQAVLSLKESSGRERMVRGRPRSSEREAEDDANDMKHAFMTGGAAALREVQAKQRLQSK